MENKDTTISFIIGAVLIIVLTIIVLDKPHNTTPTISINNIKEDSLYNVIYSLQTEIFYIEDGFDEKEHRYENVLSEYENGLSYLKDYHPIAYRDFHRIIGMKEQYNHQLERDNKKRLKFHE